MEILKKLLDCLNTCVLLPGVVVIFAWVFILGLQEVDGVSMYPYLHNRDIIGLYKLEYKFKPIQRGDVVVFQHSSTQYYVKRVIGLPGDTIMIKDGKVYINGKQLDESSYLSEGVYTSQGSFLINDIPYQVPDNQYFCMGDNRLNSTDSRDFGPVSKELIQGRVIFVLFPFEHKKIVKRVSYNLSLVYIDGQSFPNYYS